MDPRNPHSPIFAKEGESTRSSSQAVRRKEELSGLPPGIDADTAAERILVFLEKDLYLPARDLASEAIARFPDHPRLKLIWRVFDNRGKSWIAPGGPEPSRDKEFEWLRHPPEWARGKWVALVGSEAVAVGDTLKEVAESVRSQDLARRPLVHRID